LNSNAAPDLPIWPGGVAWLDGGILEVMAGDGIRVAVDYSAVAGRMSTVDPGSASNRPAPGGCR
jgi:hypothetical protein